MATQRIIAIAPDAASPSDRAACANRFHQGFLAWTRAFVLAVTLRAVSLGAASVALAEEPPGSKSPDRDAEAQRVELVRRFLVATDEAVANDLAGMIESHAQGDWRAVADALRQVRPWESLPPGRHSFALPRGTLRVQIPAEYSVEKPVPLILCIGGSIVDMDRTLDEAAKMLGEVVKTHALVAATERPCENWQACPADTSRAGDLLVAVRRNIHADMSRSFVLGWGEGGAAAWVAGLQDARELAGVVLVNADIHEDFPAIAFPRLAANLRSTRLLVMWDASSGTGETRAAGMNRALARAAIGASVETVFEELPVEPNDRSKVIQDRVRGFTAKARQNPPDSYEFWVPAGSSLRVGEITAYSSLSPEPPGLQVAAMTAPTEKGRNWLSERVEERMSHVIVRMEGPRLILEAQRCSRVDAHWPLDVVATDARRTVVCNGVTRFDETPKPSIRAMLDHARRTWDFVDASGAMTSFTIRSESP